MVSSVLSSPVTVRCKGVLFDMDGILISSLGSVERSWTKWANLRDVDPSRAMSIAHGRRAIETIAMLRPDLDAAAELRVIEDIEMKDGDGLSVLPGVLDLLASLPADRWTVVTSATDRLARVRLAMAGLPVPDRLITADSVALGKPDPAPYVAGAALLGFAPAHCTVFEDSPSGVRSGHAAGCTVVATPFSHGAEELAVADYFVADLRAVKVEMNANRDMLLLRFTPAIA